MTDVTKQWKVAYTIDDGHGEFRSINWYDQWEDASKAISNVRRSGLLVSVVDLVAPVGEESFATCDNCGAGAFYFGKAITACQGCYDIAPGWVYNTERVTI